MDYNNPYQQQNIPNMRPPINRKENMASAAMIISCLALLITILSLFSLPTLVTTLSMVLASIGIIISHLSSGNQKNLLKSARIGMICSTIALCGSVLILGYSIYVYSNSGEYRRAINEYFEDNYGEDFNDYIDGDQNGDMPPSDTPNSTQNNDNIF